MAENAVDKLRQKMAQAATQGKAAPAPNPPEGGGSMSGERENDARGQGSPARDAAAGPKSHPEKVKVAEEVIADAKARDVEDTREETSGEERHDLVIPTELNIPPSIVQERLRLGQNPATGEPWSREERMRYDREQEQARQRHAQAVRESEIRMRDEKAEADANRTANQPVPHVPVNQLTEAQKRAMQEAQDSGKGPLAQAAARDEAAPERIGQKEAEAQAMTKHDQDRINAGVDEDIERQELEQQEDAATGDEEKDPDEIQAELDENQRKSEK